MGRLMAILESRLECALKLFEEGASLKKIAKSCGLSFSQVYQVGRKYGYYVSVEAYLKKLIKDLRRKKLELSKEVNDLSIRREELINEVEELKETKEGLRKAVNEFSKGLDAVLTNLKYLCLKQEPYGLSKYLNGMEKKASTDIKELFNELDALVTPELMNDLNDLKKAINNAVASRQWKEEKLEKLNRVEEAILKIQATLVTEDYAMLTVASLKALTSLCRLLKDYSRKHPHEVRGSLTA